MSETKDGDNNETAPSSSAAAVPCAGVDLAGTYEGEYQHGRFHGKGIYTFGDSRYVGHFVDGAFHGEGTLYVKQGAYKGFWKQGKLVDGGLVFEDGLAHRKTNYKYWDYCSRYDHRFYSEIKDGLRIGDRLRDETAHRHGRSLPEGCFDTIDGYYDPRKHVVFSYTTHEVLRTPGSEEIDFILNNCRVGK